MDIEKLKKSFEGRGFTFRYFETGAEAADYLTEQLAGKTVGIGGSKTVEAIGLYEKLQGKAADVAWHWKTEPNEARARAAKAQIYVSSANGIAETGEIINIDGAGNRVASNLYGHEKVYIVAGVNKVCPDVEKAFWRARNVAAPLNARRFGKDTPCVKGELKCYDCRSPERICRGVSMLMEPMMGMPIEVVIINEELGYGFLEGRHGREKGACSNIGPRGARGAAERLRLHLRPGVPHHRGLRRVYRLAPAAGGHRRGAELSRAQAGHQQAGHSARGARLAGLQRLRRREHPRRPRLRLQRRQE